MRLGLLVIAVLTLGVSWADTVPAPVNYAKISAIDLALVFLAGRSADRTESA
jgi:hypothetical protein